MELARVRSDTRTDGGAGVCRLGVIGPAVDRLVNLLLVSYEHVVCLASMSGLRRLIFCTSYIGPFKCYKLQSTSEKYLELWITLLLPL